MKKILIIMSLLVFLLTGLSTSSFFLNDHLTRAINNKSQSAAQLNYALKQENLTALYFAWGKTQFHSEQWLLLAKKLAKTQGEVAYQVAGYYQSDPVLSLFWYKRAVRLDYPKASIALAQYYFQQEKLDKAIQVLAELPVNISENIKTQANILKVNIAINQGKLNTVKQLVNNERDKLQKNTVGRLLLADIEKYQLLLYGKKIRESHSKTLTCDNSIQLFATNLKHLKQLDSLLTDFKGQALSSEVCFSSVRYLPINALNCSSEPDKAIHCDEFKLLPWVSTINTRYVGIMLPKGGANVHFGLLYFDAQDSVDVIAHEISHLLGFIDEYPLAPEHVKCRSSQQESFSQNISILQNRYQGDRQTLRANILKQVAWAKHIKKSTPILQAISTSHAKLSWKLGTSEEFKGEVGLFNAKTCDNSAYQTVNDFSAFKPISHRTKLQYFALDFPALYKSLLQENGRQYLMPSFHYNIALAYFQQNNIKQANFWLEQAAKWERDINRRNRVRQGEF